MDVAVTSRQIHTHRPTAQKTFTVNTVCLTVFHNDIRAGCIFVHLVTRLLKKCKSHGQIWMKSSETVIEQLIRNIIYNDKNITTIYDINQLAHRPYNSTNNQSYLNFMMTRWIWICVHCEWLRSACPQHRLTLQCSQRRRRYIFDSLC